MKVFSSGDLRRSWLGECIFLACAIRASVVGNVPLTKRVRNAVKDTMDTAIHASIYSQKESQMSFHNVINRIP